MELTEKYKQEIRMWKWDTIKESALENVSDYDGQKEGTDFLGTVFGLYPSGKYYTPYANSNVDDCPRCKGKMRVKNRSINTLYHEFFKELDIIIRTKTIDTFDVWLNKHWPKEVEKILASIVKAKDHYDDTKICPTCQGVGSLEAYQDECFQEALFAVANEHGMFITSGEGDPCDIFAGIVVEEEETGIIKEKQ